VSDETGTTAAPGSKRTHKRGGGGRPQQRRDARSYAVQLLYSFDQKHYEDDGQLVPDEPENPVSSEAATFARGLFEGFCGERPAVDAVIDARLNNWTIDRLAVIDRSILRLGAYELLYCQDTPLKVVINEYIELAKIFGSEGKTAKLVNGVLDRIARECRQPG
jgi:N utilization substance protein B